MAIRLESARRAGALLLVLFALAVLAAHPHRAAAQAELMAWGNLEGIRIDGQLMPFETGICLVRPDGSEAARTAKERQRPRYSREADSRRVSSSLGGVSFTERVDDVGRGVVRLDLVVRADTQAVAGETRFCLDLPVTDFASGAVTLVDPSDTGAGGFPLAQLTAANGPGAFVTARGVRFSGDWEVEVVFDTPMAFRIRRTDRDGGSIRLGARLLPADPMARDSAVYSITIRAAGPIDTAPVDLVLDTSRPGPPFAGLGGNFRLQNARADPPVIDYNLRNLRVAWGRVELPWRSWQPEEDADPLAAARAGDIDPDVSTAMAMAQRLSQRGIPVIVSVWFPPSWAIVEDPPAGNGRRDPSGNPLDPARMDEIYKSLADYLVFLDEHYGVEAAMFSFNESDLGIDVRQTPEEHAAFIAGFGAYLRKRGLATKLLLGDTSDGTAMDFIVPAMHDADALPYIGAVSFHSWRGWSDEILKYWGDAARSLDVPLLVAEGSTDAGAWRYPAIFAEPSFAMREIDLYVRMLAISQPLSILQWQLTSDYSLLAGNGIFGDSTALHPTQRFWNLKQLAASPPDALALPIACDAPAVDCAALGHPAAGEVAVHIVNDGAARPAILRGLPGNVTELRLFVTDETRDMMEAARVPVSNGVAHFTLDATSFTTVRAGY